MSRPTFYEKLEVLEGGWTHREAGMVGNMPMAYVVVAEPLLSIFRRRAPDSLDRLVVAATKGLRDPSIPAEEKETILEEVLSRFMRSFMKTTLDVVGECLKTEREEGVVQSVSFLIYYLFAVRFAQTILFYWEFKPYGVGALDRVRESFAGFWEDELKLVSDQTRIADAGEAGRRG